MLLRGRNESYAVLRFDVKLVMQSCSILRDFLELVFELQNRKTSEPQNCTTAQLHNYITA